MEITGQSLDDILIRLYCEMIKHGASNRATRGGTLEILGVTLRLQNPRARLSRSEDRGKLFSAIGELLWYLSGSDDLEFIQGYIPRYANDAVDGVIEGAYGPRLFCMRGEIDQVKNIIKTLQDKPGSRRAVIQLFDAADIATIKKEIPCTTTLQFHLRNELLHMSTTMRSNDAYFGLPHDVFCFTMLQEMIACRIGKIPGEYIHHVGSMHIYTDQIENVKHYQKEGRQRPTQMPEMPKIDPFQIVHELLRAERRIRRNEFLSAGELFENPYWSDILRLIQVYWASKREDFDAIEKLRSEFSDDIYLPIIESRRSSQAENKKINNHGEPK